MEKQFVSEDEFEILMRDVEAKLRYKFFKNDDNINLEEMIRKISDKKYFKRFSLPLTIGRRIRNTLIHNKEREYSPILNINKEIYDQIKEFYNLLNNPPKALQSNIPVKEQQIYSAKLEDSVCKIIRTMVEKTYTHIPIYSESKLVGIFTESTFMDIVKANGEILMDKNTTFKDIINEIGVDDRSTESLSFVNREIDLFRVEDMFEKYFKNGKKLSAVFITNTGGKDEKILGIITPWDILGNN